MPPKQPKTDIYHYMAISSHVAYEIGGRVRCARCRDSFSCNPREMLLKWLSSPCIALNTEVDRPVPLPFECCHIGNQAVSFTHSLRTFKGLLYCAKCGAISQGSVLGKLAKTCTPPSTYGLRNIRNLNRGILPHGLTQWPCDANNNQHEIIGGLIPMQHLISGIAFTQAEVEAMSGLSAAYNNTLREISAAAEAANTAADAASTEPSLSSHSESD